MSSPVPSKNLNGNENLDLMEELAAISKDSIDTGDVRKAPTIVLRPRSSSIEHLL